MKNNENSTKKGDAHLYLDAAATTYPRREVVEAMCSAPWENPSSVNKYGVSVRRRIEEIRRNTQRLLSASDRTLIFTSGGTESNNTAIYDAFHRASRRYPHGGRVLLSGIDHASMDECARRLADEYGFEIAEIPIDRCGRIVYGEINFSDAAICCLTHVNNEVGAVADIERFRGALDAALSQGVLSSAPFMIVDGVQALGKIPLAAVRKGVALSDYYSISAHKIHGPKGIGALLSAQKTLCSPLHIGGSQEGGQRAGTENVAGIFGMGAAIRILEADKHFGEARSAPPDDGGVKAAGRAADAASAKKLLIAALSRHIDSGDFVVNSPDDGCPYIISVSLRGVKSEVMLHMLAEKGIAVSSASACSSAKNTVSRVIKKIGTPQEFADGTLRFSFAPDFFRGDAQMSISEDDIERTARSVAAAAAEIRKYNR